MAAHPSRRDTACRSSGRADFKRAAHTEQRPSSAHPEERKARLEGRVGDRARVLRISGFTLLEMLVALTISIILFGIALPLYSHMVDGKQDELTRMTLMDAVQFAATSAQLKHVPVALRVSEDANHLLIFTNAMNDGVLHSQENTLLVRSIKRTNHSLHWRAYPHYRDYLLFMPNGLTPSDNGTFWYCHNDSQTVIWAMTLSKTGRMRTLSPNEEGQIRDAAGRPLGCT